MRWVLWILGGLLVLLAVLAATGRDAAHAEAVLPHPPETIWALLTAPADYGSWNPVLIAAEGRFEAGATVRYSMRVGDGAASPVSAQVLVVDPPRRLVQAGGTPGLLAFENTWRLEPVPGGTRVVQHETYSGIGVWFWDPAWVEAAYGRAIAGLRARLDGAQGG